MDGATRTRINPRVFLTAERAELTQLVPELLGHVVDAIAESRAILDLPDDWDDEGSPAYEQAVWLRAADFVVSHALQVWHDRGVAVPPPQVGQGPHGSIDLHWRTDRRELLLNIPTNEHQGAAFYGDDGAGGHLVKGTLDPSEDNSWLMQWLTAA